MPGSWLYCAVLTDRLSVLTTDWLTDVIECTDWLTDSTYWLYRVYWLYCIDCTDCTDCPTNSVEQCPFSESNTFSTTEEITGILWSPRFSAAFTKARHLSLSSATSPQSTSSHPVCVRPILILSSTVRIGFPCGLISSDFPTKTLYHLSSRLSVQHAQPISSFTWSPESYFDGHCEVWRRCIAGQGFPTFLCNIVLPSLSVVTQRNAFPWPTTGILRYTNADTEQDRPCADSVSLRRGRTDGQAGMTKLIIAYPNFAYAPITLR